MLVNTESSIFTIPLSFSLMISEASAMNSPSLALLTAEFIASSQLLRKVLATIESLTPYPTLLGLLAFAFALVLLLPPTTPPLG